MADSMSQIQERTLSLFRGIILYNFTLDVAAAANHLLHRFRISVTDFIHVGNQPFIISGIPDEAGLHGLCKTAVILTRLQRRQCCKIHIYQPGHMERAHHILILIKINACFSTDAAVHLGKQCGRDLDKINAAQIGSCRKAR